MSLTTGYESELTASREEIAAALTAITAGVRSGTVHVGTGDDAISASVPDELSLEIEFEHEDDELSLELELEWPAPDDDSTVPSIGDRPGGAVEEPTSMGAADGSASLARFEVFRDRGEEWRWRLRHRNGDIIATSGEGYTRKYNAEKGLLSVIENAPDAEITEPSTD